VNQNRIIRYVRENSDAVAALRGLRMEGKNALDNCSCIDYFVGVRIGECLHYGRVYSSVIGAGGGSGARSDHSGTSGDKMMESIEINKIETGGIV
jgi:hypothetical protein